MNEIGKFVAMIAPALIAFGGSYLLYRQNRRQIETDRETEKERNGIRTAEIESERAARTQAAAQEDWARRSQMYIEFLRDGERAIIALRDVEGTMDDVHQAIVDDVSTSAARVSIGGSESVQSLSLHFMAAFSELVSKREGDSISYLVNLLDQFANEAASDLRSGDA